MDEQGLKGLLAFAQGLLATRFVDFEGDGQFSTAIATFSTMTGAEDVKGRLHGKLNCTNSATMIVDYVSGDVYGPQQYDIGAQLTREMSKSKSSASSVHPKPPRRTSNNGAFQGAMIYDSRDQTLPCLPGPYHRDARHGSVGQQRNGLVLPKGSPEATFQDKPNISTRSAVTNLIDDDDETEFLKDPVAYAKNGGQNVPDRHHIALRPSILTDLSGDFSMLSHNPAQTRANVDQQESDRIVSPAGLPNSSRPQQQQPVYSPTGQASQYGWAPNHAVTSDGEQNIRHQYPAANPADQNPPCNTLYVGNLPHNVSEDELKDIFSRQRGYKRIMLRHRNNGPVCFCEFEDIASASHALKLLYGHPLHNSSRGGVRLSFSKNPLGVRAGQASGMGPQSPLGSPGAYSGLGAALGAPPGFSAVSGPPPGLPTPGHGMGGMQSYLGSTSPTATRSFSGQTGFRNVVSSGGFGPSGSSPDAAPGYVLHRSFSGNAPAYRPNPVNTEEPRNLDQSFGFSNYVDARVPNGYRRAT